KGPMTPLAAQVTLYRTRAYAEFGGNPGFRPSFGLQAPSALRPGGDFCRRRRGDVEEVAGLGQGVELQRVSHPGQVAGVEADGLRRAGERRRAAPRLHDDVGLLLVQDALSDPRDDRFAGVGQGHGRLAAAWPAGEADADWVAVCTWLDVVDGLGDDRGGDV